MKIEELLKKDGISEISSKTASLIASIQEINMQVKKQDNAFYTKYYLNGNERREIITVCGDSACLLYEYYLRLAAIEDVVITDEDAANYFSWSIQKVQKTRLKLEKAGWYKSVRYTLTDGRKGITYYIGKEAVSKTNAIKVNKVI